MNKLISAIIVAVLSIALFSCSSKKMQSTVPYQATYPVECVTQDPSGVQVLRVWGKGLDADKAVEAARKTAVETVLFSYITRGTGKFNSLPIIDNQTIRRAHSEYFAKFFKNGGDYKKYVKTVKANKDDRLEGGNLVVVETLLQVDRPALIKKMKKDHIIE